MVTKIFMLVLGTVLGVCGTLFIQNINAVNVNKELHRKLYEEIKFNAKQGQVMELVGNFQKFETSSWDNFRGTSAFSEIPAEIQRPLDTYYLILKWYNNNLLRWKQLQDKNEGEMKMKDLADLTKEYIQFLYLKKILVLGETSKKTHDIQP